MASDNFQYTQLGGNPTGTVYGISNDVRIEALKDKNVFARIKGADLGSPYESDKIYYVPKTVSAAGRFFNATKLEQAQKYRVGVEVQLGDGEDLIIGVEHNSTGAVGEWVCFDEFELVYLGKDFNDEFVIDEDVPLNNTILMDLFQYLTNAELESGDKHVVSNLSGNADTRDETNNELICASNVCTDSNFEICCAETKEDDCIATEACISVDVCPETNDSLCERCTNNTCQVPKTRILC